MSTPPSKTEIQQRHVLWRLLDRPLVCAVACTIAVCSYLRCDPHSPPSILVYQAKPDTRHPEFLKRAIEEYDYLIADPWNLGRTPEQLDEFRRRRQDFVDLLAEVESE